MSASLETNISPRDNLNLVYDHAIRSFQQSWSCDQSQLKICLQSSSFVLLPRHIECKNNNLLFQGAFTHHNGSKMLIPAVYEDMLLTLINKNGSKFHFLIQKDRKQLLLQCSLSFPQNIPTPEKIKQCMLNLQGALPVLEKGLQLVGLKFHHNKYSLLIRKMQLKIRQNFANSIIKNQINKELSCLGELKKQNSNVIPIKQVKELIQNQKQQSKDNMMKKGGYFQVHKKLSTIIKETDEEETKIIAWKMPINSRNVAENSQTKIEKQIHLVQNIISSKYLLTYYFNKSQPSKIYMDYVSGHFKDFIFKKKINSEQFIDLAQQLIQAVGILHKSKIVHRDLKPENILFDGQKIKIIDYAESAQMDQKFQEKHSLGSTIPYSPFECILGKQQGFNKQQIDLWSIPIMLYQLAFKSIPFFYNRWIGGDILQKWRSTSQFSIFPIHRKRRALRSIQSILSLVTIRGLQIKPQQRLGLNTYYQLILQLKQFHQSILSI